MPNCLIADDSKIMRMLLTKIMENFGYTVSEAEDGEFRLYGQRSRRR